MISRVAKACLNALKYIFKPSPANTVEWYLSQSADYADLERRIKKLNSSDPWGQIRYGSHGGFRT